MHLVFLNQYYPPDAAPTGVMLEGLVEELVRDGHEVTVLCASGGYAGSAERKEVIRDQWSVISAKNETTASPCSSSNQPSTLTPSKPSAAAPEPHELVVTHSAFNHQLSTPSPRIIRLRASRFGRGTFMGKLLDYASYYGGVAWKLLVMQPKPDRIVALTTPPLLSVLARLLSKIRGADHAHWVMDLYPDVMAAHGMLGEKSLIYRILAGLARWGFGGRRCAAVLTLGPDMAARVATLVGEKPSVISEEKEGDEETVVGCPLSVVGGASAPLQSLPPTADNGQPTTVSWVPLWGVEVIREEEEGDEDIAAPYDSQPSTASAALRRRRGWGDDELIAMYSGNMGLGHRFGEILAAAKRVGEALSVVSHPLSVGLPCDSMALRTTDNRQPTTPQSIRCVFFGGGKRRVEVESFARENPGCAVEVYDYAPAEELAAHLQSADVHLASLDAAWTGTMVPSKLQGIFAAGRPVIFIGSEESSIGRWVAESGGGWLVPPGDVDGLLAALEEARDPAARLTRGRAAKDFAEMHFDKRANVARVAAIFTRPC